MAANPHELKYRRVRVASVRRAPAIVLVVLLSILAAGCGGSSNNASSDTTGTAAAASCKKSDLNLVNAGELTVGHGQSGLPAVVRRRREGAVEGQRSVFRPGLRERRDVRGRQKLGFANSEVNWIVVPFNTSFAPGPKKFDFDINQISFTPARAKAVDFSDSYYDVNQAVVIKGKPDRQRDVDRRPEAVQARRPARDDELRLHRQEHQAVQAAGGVRHERRGRRGAEEQADRRARRRPADRVLRRRRRRSRRHVRSVTDGRDARAFGMVFAKGNSLVSASTRRGAAPAERHAASLQQVAPRLTLPC